LICWGVCAGGFHAAFAARYAVEQYGKERLMGCFLDRPIASIELVVKENMGFLALPLAPLTAWLYPYQLEEELKLLPKELPLGIFLGGSDELVGPAHQEILNRACAERGETPCILEGLGHEKSWMLEGVGSKAREVILDKLGYGA
jgi:fermentation-respiration switch protein FrsA (DUF1100 family)